MSQRLFITDFDGTLLRDDKQISATDLTGLKQMQDKHIICAVATGRSLYSFTRAIAQMNFDSKVKALPVDYIIFSTGAGVIRYSDSKILFNKSLTSEDVKRISDYFQDRKFDFMIHESIPRTQQFLYKKNRENNPDFDHRIKLYSDCATPINSNMVHVKSATEVLAIIPNGVQKEFIDRIQSDLSDYSVIHATSPLDHQSSWIEIFKKEVSKSQTAHWLSNHLNVSRENIISVGNDYNDSDLLAWSAKGYVVENAPHSLKTQFQNVKSNNESGVAHAALLSGLLD